MNDPAFLFYPGDYLRDTQCLTSEAQVAYDRIMCEHMRNICISQTTLNFLTKKLEADERAQIFEILEKVDDGFAIPWVRESIIKRREYSESRRNNRKSKPKKEDKPTANTSSTYVPHMENENEIVIGDRIDLEKGVQGEKQLTPEMWEKLPDKVNEYADQALNDYKFLESAQKINPKITKEAYIEIINYFRERQIHGQEYYHAYQRFKWHLVNTKLFNNYDPKKGKEYQSKFEQALKTDLHSMIQYD
jgi:hypothetical protein